MELKNLDVFLEIAKSKPKKSIVVAAAEDEHVLGAIRDAIKENIVEPVLIGDVEKIKVIAAEIGLDLSSIELIDEKKPTLACKKAVKFVRDGNAQVLMKGLVSTADFLRAVLNKEEGLRKGELLSHIGFFDPPAYHKVIALTDAAQNIMPTIQEKVAIINNSVDLFHHLGVENPKIAALGAVEVVNPKMEATMDAAILTQMNQRKQIKGCLIDGPLAFDNAVSKEAAHHKGIDSSVAGDADMLFVSNIDIGNVLYKSFTYFGNASVAACILGATVPIVLTSRADSDRSKMLSIALAAAY
jgi:phosphate butyryltransferase